MLKFAEMCSLASIMTSLRSVQEKPLEAFIEFDAVVRPQILITDAGYIFAFRLRTKRIVLDMHGPKVTSLLERNTLLPDPDQEEPLFCLSNAQKIRPRTCQSLDRMLRWFSERGMLADVVSIRTRPGVSTQLSQPSIWSSS